MSHTHSFLGTRIAGKVIGSDLFHSHESSDSDFEIALSGDTAPVLNRETEMTTGSDGLARITVIQPVALKLESKHRHDVFHLGVHMGKLPAQRMKAGWTSEPVFEETKKK